MIADEIERPSDGAIVKVTTRLTNGRARAMRIAAAQQGIKIEAAYREAVTAYLQKNG
jgi:plasmid stability protein